MQNKIESAQMDYVRNTLLINHFHKILSLCEENVPIIPLKGLSLLFSIYKEDYARNVGDMDIFVSENNLETLVSALKKLGYVFKKQNINYILRAKGKFDMIHPDKKQYDLDIHIDLITKKFYRNSTGNFTSFALSRLRTIEHNGKTIFLLSPVDEWLYLAQHYCHHLFANDKWLKDLYLLQNGFSDKEIMELVTLAKRFRFERVVTAVHRHLRYKYPQNAIQIPELVIKKHFVFDRLFRNPNRKYSYTFSNRLIAVYWKFIFIDNFQFRLKAYMRLLFPELNVLSDIYNCPSRMIGLIYPFHFVLVLFSSCLFLPVLLIKNRYKRE